MLNIFWEGKMFDMTNNIQNNSDEKRINNIVNELCMRSGEHILSLKNEGDNKTFFAEHLPEIARAVANVEQKDLNNGENKLNEFLFMCIGLFDTDESRQIIYDKLTDEGIFYVYKNMSDGKKIQYISHLPKHLCNNYSFLERLDVNPNGKFAKRFNSLEGFINKRKNEDSPWKLAKSEKDFFVEHKNEIRDKIASLGKENFDGDEDAANKYKLLCCQLFSYARDRQVIFETIGDGSDADIILTFQKLKLDHKSRRELFVHLPETLQITEAFQYAGFKDELLKDLERKMLEEFTFEIWKDYALSLGFTFLLILSVPTGLTNLILWCSSDYRKTLKQEKIDDKRGWRSDKELSEEDEKDIKSEMRLEFIAAVLVSLYPAFNFALVTYCFIVLPFGVFLSSCWLFLVLELGLMVYMFIVMFELIKSLCKEIKDAVKNNKQIQRTLNERRDKWRETKQEIESKQREASAPKILLIDDRPAWSKNKINTDSNKNLVLDNMDNDFELEK